MLVLLHFAMPDRQGTRGDTVQEGHFATGLHSLVVRSSRGYAYSQVIGVAGAGSGGIDIFIWLSNRMIQHV